MRKVLRIRPRGRSLFCFIFSLGVYSLALAQGVSREPSWDTPEELISRALSLNAVIVVGDELSGRPLLERMRRKLSEDELVNVFMPFLIKNCLALIDVQQVLQPASLRQIKTLHLVQACGGGRRIILEQQLGDQPSPTPPAEIVMRPVFDNPGTKWLLFVEPVETGSFDQAGQRAIQFLQSKGVFLSPDEGFFRIVPADSGKAAFKVAASGREPGEDLSVVEQAFLNDLQAILTGSVMLKWGQLQTGLGRSIASRIAGHR